jgi:fatty acid desaturase
LNTCCLSWIFIHCLDNRCCQRIHHWSPDIEYHKLS